jgi:hypothetical protein
VQWATLTVLKINRHDYYQTADKAASVQDSVRVYDITATHRRRWQSHHRH